MIPSYGLKLQDNPELIREIQATTGRALGLKTELQAAVK
jgi:hypothetical protein